MASGFLLGFCKCGLAVAVIPLAVVVAALLEKPTVTVLPLPEGTVVASEATEMTAAEDEATRTPVSETGERLGSGSMFDRIAFAYDSTNKWMSLGLDQYWRKTLIQECMQLAGDDKVLDLATGTADVSLLAGGRLRQLNENGTLSADAVLGVDPSSEMLRRGLAKVEGQGFNGVVRLVKGDAQDLSQVRGIDVEGKLSAPTAGVASQSIDKISMAFGIRNVPDRSRALREMRRVLRNRESSRVCILEFSLPDGKSFLSKVARRFITHVVPAIGRVATIGSGKDEYEYLEKSILEFPQPTDFASSMAREGLAVRSITSFAYGAVHLYAAVPVVGKR